MSRSEVEEELVGRGAVDEDVVMREALHRESVEVLRGQLEAERAGAARFQRPDVFLSFLLGGIGVGIGIGAASRQRDCRRRSR